MMEGCNVVNAVEISAVLRGEDAHDDGGEWGSFGERGGGEDFTEKAFAGERHEDGAVCHAQRGKVADESQVVCRGFAEADAGVQADAGRGDAVRPGQGNALFKEGANLCHNIGIGGGKLHGLRGALHVHEDDATGVGGTEGAHFCGGQAGNVINNVCTRGEGSSRYGGVTGVYGDEGVGKFAADGGDDGGGAAFLQLRGDGGGTGASGLPADVDDVGSLVQHAPCMFNCGGYGIIGATVGEGVGGDVENAHDTACSGDFPKLMAQLPGEG